MRRLVRDAGLQDAVRLDSAGTGDWHIGNPPDARATAAAALREITVDGRARQVTPADFADHDLIVAMDRANQRELLRLAPDEEARSRVVLLRDYDPEANGHLDVPDPYYGGADGFEEVLDIVERSCRNLLSTL
jgi:protein-tyrosine phosphatase